jgi:hypothetical protein
MTIINYASSIANKLKAFLTDDARVVIYDHHVFIVQATDLPLSWGPNFRQELSEAEFSAKIRLNENQRNDQRAIDDHYWLHIAPKELGCAKGPVAQCYKTFCRGNLPPFRGNAFILCYKAIFPW